jgi:hypothetical protein
MLFASLWRPAPQGPIERSSAFQALDSAEKSAVNHFLGGIAAKLAADGQFGGAWLAHVDQVLRAHGIPVRGSRPDFLGTDLFGCQLVVEAKGHSRLDPRTVAGAKRQAASLPPLPGGGPNLAYAQVATFSTRSNAASASRRLLAGAATVTLTSGNAAETGECGRTWSQSSWKWPPMWSQFGRSPACRQSSVTRSPGR